MIRLIITALAVSLLITSSGCSSVKKVTVFHAGSLARPMRELKEHFEKDHPDVEIILEAAGSRACCRKVSELSRSADIVAVSDYLVIEDLLMPEFASWHISFAGNSMVIAYSDHSRYGSEITAHNWFEIMARPDVNFGHSDPDLDPCGYRTDIIWQLADLHYEKEIHKSMISQSKPRNIRPTEIELVALLENFALDYAFQYRSIALQYHLKFLELPDTVNLGTSDLVNLYKKAETVITGKNPVDKTTVRGTPIRYAFTILENAPEREAALDFASFMLSEQGRELIKKNHQPLILPAIASDRKKVPEKLLRYCNEN